jgi:hypothetical protein
MAELIALFILICSLTVITIMLFRKIPLLLELPETLPGRLKWKDVFLTFKNSIPFGKFPTEAFLQKILSRVRVLTLKTDNKTSNWLQRLRRSSAKKKFGENDNYWQEIKDLRKDEPR